MFNLLEDEMIKKIEDRLEGFELIEYLQVPVEQILLAALENDWINEENVEDLLEFVGVRR